jgi:hydrogenase large subunit
MKSKKSIVFSPFTRVEGNLTLSVEITDGAVASARASGTLFRGFEDMLRGHYPTDAIVMLCRICGQCGGAHSSAAAGALARAGGGDPPRNAILATAVIQGVEMALSHLGHFGFSFAADLCALPGLEELGERFAPIRGTSFRRTLRTRRDLLGLMGMFAGKWPNTLAIHPGGVTRPLNRAELLRCRGILAEFRRSLEEGFLGCALPEWLEVRSPEDMDRWTADPAHAEGDLATFVRVAREAGLQDIGAGPGRFLSAGGFKLPGGKTWLRAGYYNGGAEPLDQNEVSEHVEYSWFEAGEGSAHPSVARAIPSPDKEQAYSWAKAPRYRGKSVEVGPLARMAIDGDEFAASLLAEYGPSVFTRVLLRLHELVRLVADMEGWLRDIDPDEPFCEHYEPPSAGSGFALTDAPRGLLGHWVTVERDRVRNYQVITPTSWNLSPRDAEGHPGPLEEALVGTPVRDPEKAVNVALVVRSYDPCLYCSVH